jgi:acyl dehydratase
MARTTLQGIDGVKAAVGTTLGVSDWRTITQDDVNLFAEATGDHQWIHVDPERAKDGPFGGTIAHGYLTLSLAPVLISEVVDLEGVTMGVNYGCNKVRFIAPVPVGKAVRMSAVLSGADDVPGGVQATIDLTFEIEDVEKPACVAQVVYRWLF